MTIIVRNRNSFLISGVSVERRVHIVYFNSDISKRTGDYFHRGLDYNSRGADEICKFTNNIKRI